MEISIKTIYFHDENDNAANWEAVKADTAVIDAQTNLMELFKGMIQSGYVDLSGGTGVCVMLFGGASVRFGGIDLVSLDIESGTFYMLVPQNLQSISKWVTIEKRNIVFQFFPTKAARAKHIFLVCYGLPERMRQDGLFEEYSSYAVSKADEQTWQKEVETLF